MVLRSFPRRDFGCGKGREGVMGGQGAGSRVHRGSRVVWGENGRSLRLGGEGVGKWSCHWICTCLD